MFQMCWLWIKHRWPGVSAAAIVLLAVLIVTLVATDGAGLGITLLGNANAPRAAGEALSKPILPRSSDPNAASGSTSKSDAPGTSALDESVSAEGGPQTVTAAQAAWSNDEIKKHQHELLAALNCERKIKGQPALALDSTLSVAAGEAWLKLIHEHSFTLLDLPGHYELRSVMALDFGIAAQAAQGNQQAQQPDQATHCEVGGFDVAALPQTTGGTGVGIAVFPPQASWDGSSAVVLVK